MNGTLNIACQCRIFNNGWRKVFDVAPNMAPR
jgi:hypothetical protein